MVIDNSKTYWFFFGKNLYAESITHLSLSLSLSLSLLVEKDMMILGHISLLKWPNSSKNRYQIGISYPDQIHTNGGRKKSKSLTLLRCGITCTIWEVLSQTSDPDSAEDISPPAICLKKQNYVKQDAWK